ncbi:MAG TPA: D-alanyl-D-alanine carboxypeptidase/D-alanyl-D-alanine-endopeptidase [Burkholderiales bacterium]|nr:D-alanyl-D-alanine carboxypeptidase/D-alanyl-D-alanine-endopeptidase [Burkholderiales bacterium]
MIERLVRTGTARLACLVLLLSPLAASAHTSTTNLPPELARIVERSGIPPANIGIFVQPVESSRPGVAFNATHPFDPASTMKLVTTYAALSLLGPAYTWNTDVYATGPIRNGVLDGDLYIKGYGDPELTLEDFWLLLRELRARGLKTVHGDLVLDTTYFIVPPGDPGGFDGEPSRPYNTLPSALLVNYNAVRIDFIPRPHHGLVAVTVEPPLPQVKVVNHLRLTDGACGDWKDRLRATIDDNGNAATIAYDGRFSASCGEKQRHVAVLSKPQYLFGLFSGLWRELGGTLSGTVREAAVPPSATLLLEAQSPTLTQVIHDMNKFSNNVMARTLFLTIGAENGGPPGTVENAARTIKLWLAQSGIPAPGLVLENGSGLSRVERVSAGTLGQLLISAWHSPVMPELAASLPLVAEDGTMRRRLRHTAIAGHAHIKTGSLAASRAIAGYVLDHDGHRVVVVCLINDPRTAAARALQNRLLKWVYNNGTSPAMTIR